MRLDLPAQKYFSGRGPITPNLFDLSEAQTAEGSPDLSPKKKAGSGFPLERAVRTQSDVRLGGGGAFGEDGNIPAPEEFSALFISVISHLYFLVSLSARLLLPSFRANRQKWKFITVPITLASNTKSFLISSILIINYGAFYRSVSSDGSVA